MTDKHDEFQEEKKSSLPDFPSEQDLETWKQEQEMKKEELMKQSPKEELDEMSLDNTKIIEQSEPKETLQKSEATDFFIHNHNDEKSETELSELRKENGNEWGHLTQSEEEQEPIRQYHDFPLYFYAGFWMRFWAFCVDTMCIGSITSLILGVLSTVVALNAMMVGFVSGVIYLAYFVLMTKYTNGQTIGKMIFGLKVVSFTEKELSWSTIIVREGACRFILQIGPLMLGYIVAAFTSRKQHIGDLFSDTSVVTINTLKAYNGQIK